MEEKGNIFLSRRKPGDRLEHKWEFPGGKVEPGQTTEQCLERGSGLGVRDPRLGIRGLGLVTRYPNSALVTRRSALSSVSLPLYPFTDSPTFLCACLPRAQSRGASSPCFTPSLSLDTGRRGTPGKWSGKTQHQDGWKNTFQLFPRNSRRYGFFCSWHIWAGCF